MHKPPEPRAAVAGRPRKPAFGRQRRRRHGPRATTCRVDNHGCRHSRTIVRSVAPPLENSSSSARLPTIVPARRSAAGRAASPDCAEPHRQEFLSNLPLECNAMGSVLAHEVHPSKARHPDQRKLVSLSGQGNFTYRWSALGARSRQRKMNPRSYMSIGLMAFRALTD